jgi:hypothetical protein
MVLIALCCIVSPFLFLFAFPVCPAAKKKPGEQSNIFVSSAYSSEKPSPTAPSPKAISNFNF